MTDRKIAAIFLPAAACLILSLAPVATAIGQVTFSQIALEGDLAPGTADGAEFGSFFFGTPAINASGDVTFLATLSTGPGGTAVTDDNDTAIFGPSSGAGSALGLIVRENDLAPGVADGAVFSSLASPGSSSPTINASGDVAFQAVLRTGASGTAVTDDNNTAVFGPSSGAGSALGLIAREGDLAPGVPDGAEFTSVRSPALNDSGDVAFTATLGTGSGGTPVASDNSFAIFGPSSGAGSALGSIVRAGEPAPGAADGAEFSSFLGTPALNASGDVAFLASLSTGSGGAPVTSDNSFAIFGPSSGAGSALGQIARTDGLAPGVADGAEFDGFGGFDAYSALNDSGDVAFIASLRTGPGGTPVTNGNDTAVFGPSSGAGSALGLIAREGDEVPGVADGTLFSSFSTFDFLGGIPLFFPVSEVAINASGDVAFLANLPTAPGFTVPGLADEALFAFVDGELQLIVREGDQFDVLLENGLTEQRTISGIDFGTNGLNDAGVLAFELAFIGGTSGIFTADNISGVAIPEPASLALLGMGAVGLLTRRRWG